MKPDGRSTLRSRKAKDSTNATATGATQASERHAPPAPSAFYRPVKQSTTVRIDVDVLEWLKAQGPGYQTRINALLRQAMEAELKK
jgi:uncharacterized protein (DUF4415 family)